MEVRKVKPQNRLVKLLSLFILSAAAWGEARITVRIVNSAVPVRMRLAGQRLAAEILRSAGVEADWVDCSGGLASRCAGPLRRGEFWLHLVDALPPRKLSGSAGFAVLYPAAGGREGYAGVFYPRVIQAANQEDFDPAIVLGATIAHEIGHVLLGSKAHSPSGVMRSRLRRTEFEAALRGALRFTSQEAEMIRRAWDNSPIRCPTRKSSLP